MARFLARRFAIWTMSLVGASILIFAMMNSLGGDAASVLLGEHATPESVAALRHELGLDRPFWVRYAKWVEGMASGHILVDIQNEYFPGGRMELAGIRRRI